MTAPAVPLRPRPMWREPRFLLGLLLVIASVAGVAGLLAASERTVQVFAARHALAAGDEVTAADLVGVRVRLGAAQAAYLSSAPEADTVVTRTIAAGELVPVGALGAASAQRQTSVMIAVGGELPASVTAGAAVDVWAAAASGAVGAGAPKFAAPEVLVPRATVVRVVRDTGLGATGGIAVEVRVPKDATAGLLEAIANGSAITLLPAGE
ncbi:MAG: SAF domain-containing protein [Microbacteriaceae bacterium]|nr:SAF domain-containing protein [Microbacteriaceae bacterium]